MTDPVLKLVNDMFLKVYEPEPRRVKQERVDNLLRDFNADYLEASELLDALFSGFRHRYSDAEWDRVEIALEKFKDRLYRVSQMIAEDDPE